tara:strand:+ start:396 stop:875 length:480 start_codon:yes stop_codon:yes gene_type:complete
MPIYDNYLSDASLVESDSESDEDEEELYDERDQEYWNIEALLDDHRPPPVIEFSTKLGVVALYGCVTGPIRSDIESVVSPASCSTWKSYWSGAPEEIRHNAFSHAEWDAIGCWIMQLCECCCERPTMTEIRSCMIRVLLHGRFIRPPVGRVVSVNRHRH